MANPHLHISLILSFITYHIRFDFRRGVKFAKLVNAGLKIILIYWVQFNEKIYWLLEEKANYMLKKAQDISRDAILYWKRVYQVIH